MKNSGDKNQLTISLETQVHEMNIVELKPYQHDLSRRQLQTLASTIFQYQYSAVTDNISRLYTFELT